VQLDPRRAAAGLIALTVMLPVTITCSRSPQTGVLSEVPPRLVLLVAACTVNKNYLSPYNRGISFTPHLAELARDGLVFERHITETGQSGPAYASIFSGSQADVHGSFRNHEKISDDLYLIGEAFRDGGFEPFYFAGHPMASPKLNYAQGVPGVNVVDGNAGLTGGTPEFRALLRELREDPERRAFVYTSFTVSHHPYPLVQLSEFLAEHPEEANGLTEAEIRSCHDVFEENHLELQWNFAETAIALGLKESELARFVAAIEVAYKSRIWFLDKKVGAIIEQVRQHGLIDESLIVFTADHGEMLYRDNALFKWEHGQILAPEVLEVPLILRGPTLGGVAGRYEGVTRSIDVYPTLVGLTGLLSDLGDTVYGVDLTRWIRDGGETLDLGALSHTTVAGRMRLEIGQGWKLLRKYYPRADPNLMWAAVRRGDRVFKLRPSAEGAWRVEAFDLAQDPEERVDIFDPDRARSSDEEDQPTGEDEIKALRSLGYVR